MPRPELQGRPLARRVVTGTTKRRIKEQSHVSGHILWMALANVHGEVVGEGERKVLSIVKAY
ncbi:MAG: hypothetical protein JSW07_16335 [bacterium]|nr:MAG: hypothetical protein JSW07_16335 [bacterium]